MRFLLDYTTTEVLRDVFGALCIGLLIFVFRDGRKIQGIHNEKQALLESLLSLRRLLRKQTPSSHASSQKRAQRKTNIYKGRRRRS